MRTIHFRSLPDVDEETLIEQLWGFEQTNADRAAIEEFHEECRRVAAGVALARQIEETATRFDRCLPETFARAA